MTCEIIEGRDVYLRLGDGPVQHFRCWDADRFFSAQVKAGREHTDAKGAPAPYEVRPSTRAEYLAERHG